MQLQGLDSGEGRHKIERNIWEEAPMFQRADVGKDDCVQSGVKVDSETGVICILEKNVIVLQALGAAFAIDPECSRSFLAGSK
jgi:hypothetical protein